MNLTYFRSEMRGNVERNNNPVNIRFVDKTSDIINVAENITSDVMLNIRSGNTGILWRIYAEWRPWQSAPFRII